MPAGGGCQLGGGGWQVSVRHSTPELTGVVSGAVAFPTLCPHFNRGHGLSQIQDPVSKNTCRFGDHVEETGLGSASSHAPPLCHTVLRPWHKRPQAAFFARRLIIALPRAVFLQSLGNVSPFLSFLFLSRVYK